MVLSGPPTPVGGAQAVSQSTLLRTNSGLLGAQGGAPSQPAFPSLVSPRSQYGNMNLLGNLPNVSSLLGGGGAAGICMNQSFANGGNGPQPSGSNSGLSASGSFHRGGGIDMVAESDPLSGFDSPPSSFGAQNAAIPCTSGLNGSLVGSGGATLQQHGQGQVQHFSNSSSTQIVQEQQQQQQPQQLEVQNFQQGQHGQQGQDPSNNLQMQPQQMLGGRGLQQFPAPNSLGMGASQQQLQSLRNLATVKLEPQMANDQTGQPQLSSSRNLASVKLEPQQLALRNLPSIKMEPQHLDQSSLLQQQQQQQQQQFLQMSRQSSQQMQLQAAHQLNLLQHQRLLQLQQQQQHQQQQQQMLKTLPPQRSQLQQQALQQFQQQNLPMRSSVKQAIYEPGMCARRLTHYMYNQQHRPADNSIEFWRKFVAEYFAPHAKKRWCVSLYGTGRQTTGVFPQDVWHCEICKRKPGRGFETTVEVLPRLCKIKYDSGTLEELLYVDMPREYQTASGHIVLDYAKAIQESVFEQLRVVRDGQLRIVFSSDLKICSWEFCARRHEELIPRRLIIPQVTHLGVVAQKYQAATQNGLSTLSSQDLQNNCNLFVSTARQLAKSLEVPLVNDLGYTKRYVRCLQISEVVNSMKDLIDYSRETGTGPMASLINFPRRNSNSSGLHSQNQQTEEQAAQNSNNEQNSVQATVPLSAGNGPVNAPSTSTSTSTIVGLLHQNSMNSRQENNGPLSNSSSPYGNSVQIPSTTSSNSLQQSQPNPSSPFQNPTPSQSNNPQQLPNSVTSSISMQQSTQSNEIDPNDCQNSVQQIIQEMMMSSQLNRGNTNMVGAMGNEIKSLNGITQAGNSLVGNGIANSVGIGGMAYGNMGGANGIRASMAGNSLALNGRGLGQDPNHQQDLGSRYLSGLGTVNNFNNLQFDWKSSP